MESSTTTIECTRDVADEIADDLRRLVDGDVARADKNNLDGGLQTVLLVVQTASPIVASLVPLLVAHLQNSKIARLKFKKPDGTEVEITNPSKEQLEKYV
jgi:hypothetical protein